MENTKPVAIADATDDFTSVPILRLRLPLDCVPLLPPCLTSLISLSGPKPAADTILTVAPKK